MKLEREREREKLFDDNSKFSLNSHNNFKYKSAKNILKKEKYCFILNINFFI